MRISLKVGETLHALAGAAGVSERVHSSAADWRHQPSAAKQGINRVRAANALEKDRGNLLHVVSFSTTRMFATPAEAFLFDLFYDSNYPREGSLIMDAIAPNGTITRSSMANALVSPPARRVIGCTVMLDYTVSGGLISAAQVVDEITITGTMTSNGTAAATFARLYDAGLAAGKPHYTFDGLPNAGTGDRVMWVAFVNYWAIIKGATIMFTSTENVATPNLVTAWTPSSPATGTPIVTLSEA
jgi:hypothetical protein